MHIQYPLEEFAQRLIGDVEFYRRRHRNPVITGALDVDTAKEIIQAIIELQLQLAMRWTVKPKDAYAYMDAALRKAYPDYDPDRSEFNGEAQLTTGSQHLFIKVIDPLYCDLQNLIHGVLGASHTWDIWEVRIFHPTVRVAVAVDAFGGPTAEEYKGKTGLDYVDRRGPWMLEMTNQGDYRVLDWMRRFEAGEIEPDGKSPVLDEQFEDSSAEILTLPMLLVPVGNIRTFGKPNEPSSAI